jgi:inosose dehydratase
MTVKVAVAPDSWGIWFPDDPQQTPSSRFLDEVVEAGFDAIELGPFGYLPTDRNLLKQALDSHGLTLTGAFVFQDFQESGAWSQIQDEVARICELLNAFGSRYLVLLNTMYTDLLTGAPGPTRSLDDDGWKRMMETVHAIGAYAHQQGIRAVYHPHADSFVQHEDEIERFLNASDPETMSLCLDVGHHAYGGGDPVAFMARHHDRIPYLHIKNVDRDVMETVRAHNYPFRKAVDMAAFTTLEDGIVDFVALRDVLTAVHFDGWAVVEQDMYPAPLDKPLPIARRNRQYLHQIGLG